jgi:hypothetical protein
MKSNLKTDVVYEYDAHTGKNTIISLNEVKQYKLHLFELRNNIISSIKNDNIALPQYHIIITYYNQYNDRSFITRKHRFIRNQVEEIFNPRYRNQSDKSSIFFFCERHKRKLISSCGNRYYLFNQVKTDNMVKDTITNMKEYDLVDSEVSEGAYHSHILKSEIPDSIILQPNGKAKKLIQETFGYEQVKQNIDMISLQKIKKDLLEAVCRKCDIVGNSKDSVKVVLADNQYYWDNYYGWEGYIAYATKTCYNPYMMMDVIDNDNSSLSIFPARQPIKQAQKKTIYREENE